MKIFKLKKQEFLYLLIFSFLFIGSSALALSRPIISMENATINTLINKPAKSFPPLPVLGATSSFPVISAQGAYILDLGSGIPLYEKNPDAKLLPASTTKIVTALVALDSYNLGQVIKIPKGVRVDGQKIGLFEGEEMTVENLLYALLVYSANDAAEALSGSYPLGRDAFVNLMNLKAMELSMNNSHFVNPVGFDGEGQYSTARDLIRVTEAAMRNTTFAEMVGTKEIVVSDVSGKNKYRIKNINKLLGEIPGVMGIKTGWTENARENLVTYIERDNHKVIIALLGSSDRFGETKELINWIFTSYDWQEVKP